MQNNSTYEQELAIVYRERNGRATLVPLTIDSTGSGRQIFERIRDKQREMSALHGRLTSLLLLLAQYEVAIAEIRWVRFRRLILQKIFRLRGTETDTLQHIRK